MDEKLNNRKVKFREARPYLGRQQGVDYFIAFRIPKGSPLYAQIVEGWDVIVGEGMDNWAGTVIETPQEKTWGALKGKNVVARVRYRAAHSSALRVEDEDAVKPNPDVNDPETVTVSVGPPGGTQTEVISDTDVVYDIP